MNHADKNTSSICYHEVVRDDLQSIMRDGLKLAPDGAKDTDLITKVNELLDTHRTPRFIELGVSRVDAIYGYLPAHDGVISITSGKTIPIVRAISDSDHALLKLRIEPNRCYVSDLELYDQIKDTVEDGDRQQFIDFAFDFVVNMQDSFFTLTPDNAKKCKQIIFPAGFYMDDSKNVYTPEISPLIRLATKKKDTEVSEISHLVRVRRL